MPYLDGSPAPSDATAAAPEGRTNITIEIDEPEEMIAQLLKFVADCTGRRITSINVEWLNANNLHGSGDNYFPTLIDAKSVMNIGARHAQEANDRTVLR